MINSISDLIILYEKKILKGIDFELMDVDASEISPFFCPDQRIAGYFSDFVVKFFFFLF